MNALFAALRGFIQDPGFATAWLDALLKSFVILVFAGMLYLTWRRAAAATRHLIWFLAMASLPFLPLLSHVLPASHRPLWSVSGGPVSGNQVSLSLELGPDQSRNAISQPAPVSPQIPVDGPRGGNVKQVFSATVSQSWLTIGFIAWAVGIALALIHFSLGQFRLRKIAHTAAVLDTAEWRLLLNQACETLRLRRRVILLQSRENVMPLTWGWLRPKVLMPLEAAQWPAERRRIVLLHELAHVKRWDCLTQFIARTACALYWFNPLAWIAARRMCIERERACDDLVLNGGCKASDYAGHLVQIARTFWRAPQAAGIAMARSSNLEQRVTAIVDASRVRRLRPIGLAGLSISIAAVIFCIGGYKTSLASDSDSSLRQQQLARLEKFSAEKLKQSQILAASSGEAMTQEFQRLFDAATTGDFQTVTNMYESFKQRHPQYARSNGVPADFRLRKSYWSPVLEIDLAYDQVTRCDPKYTEIAVDDMVNAIPPGSIYFGGTDPGRGLPTAFSKSHVAADPFYTLTQNALADGSYLEYLENTYGDKRQTLETLAAARTQDSEMSALDKEYQAALDKQYPLNERPYDDPELKAAKNACYELEQKVNAREDEILARIKSGAIAPVQTPILGATPQTIYIATSQDSQKSFEDYLTDGKARALHDKQFPNEPKQLKSGEEIRVDDNGNVQVSGQVAVMAINARIVKVIFDKNPGHEFYIEESFPLDWMYPNLEPHGPIMKINREPLAAMPDDVVRKDREYWKNRVGGMIGDWIHDETPVQAVTSFADKVFTRRDLSGFTGDPQFVQNEYASKSFAHWRYSIAGVYAWRAQNGNSEAEKQRMAREADYAFRQAFALCPYSKDGVRYVEFLKGQGRMADARLIADTATRAAAVWEKNETKLRELSEQLKESIGK